MNGETIVVDEQPADGTAPPPPKRSHKATGNPRGRPPKGGRPPSSGQGPKAADAPPPISDDAKRAAAEAGADFLVGTYASALEAAFPGQGAAAVESRKAYLRESIVALELHYGRNIDPVWLMWGAFLANAVAPVGELVLQHSGMTGPPPAPPMKDVTPPAPEQKEAEQTL